MEVITMSENKVETAIANIKTDIISAKIVIIVAMVMFILGGGLGVYFTYTHYNAKLEVANATITDLTAKYSEIEAAKEAAIIAKAQAEDKANIPIVVSDTDKTTTSVSYEAKTSASDADTVVNTSTLHKFEYNGVLYDIPEVKPTVKPTTTSNGTTSVTGTSTNGGAATGTKTGETTSTITGGKLVLTQQTVSVLNVDDIVNRQIADTVNKKDTQIRILKREKVQQTFWGIVGGVVVGKYIAK